MNLEKSTVISAVITLFPLSNRTVITQFSSVLFYFFVFFILFFLLFFSMLLFFPINFFIFEFECKILKLDLYSDVLIYLFRLCSIHHSQADQGWVVQLVSFITLTS